MNMVPDVFDALLNVLTTLSDRVLPMVPMLAAAMVLLLGGAVLAHWVRYGVQELMDAVVKLSQEPDPRYARAQGLAYHYVHGIPTQPDETSPTGYWRGMLVEENDWEMFAGLASGIMGDVTLLPPYVRRFFAGLFVGASDTDTVEA